MKDKFRKLVKLIEDNKIKIISRIKELVIDYLVILAYLAFLAIVTISIYYFVLKGIPDFTETQSQVIATLTSVIPIALIFSILDYHGGSIGKRKTRLALFFEKKTFFESLLRNIVKFLPWQLGHLGVIRGMYTDFDQLSIVLVFLSMGLLLIMLGMGLFRKDKRHLGDLIAKTQVQERI